MSKPNVSSSRITFVIVVAGSTILFGMIRSRPTIPRHHLRHPIPTVEVHDATPVTLQAPVIGYGTIRPKRQVQIIPEVGGQLVAAHPSLAPGNVVAKGQLLFQIDTRRAESQVTQVQAEIRRLQAQLQRHQLDAEQLAQQLDIAEQQLALAQNSVQRERQLRDNGSGTQLELEAVQERLLNYQQAVLACRAQLDAIPTLIAETTAVLDLKQAQLQEAQLSIEKARIYCPFDARVDQVTAQVPEVIVAGVPMASLTDIEAVELPVAIDPQDLNWLPEDLLADPPTANLPPVRVTWAVSQPPAAWSGRVTRLERLDEATRRAHLIIELSGGTPRHGNQAYSVPSIGMFCRVEIPTAPVSNAVVLPRSAMYDGQSVYVFEPEADDPVRGHLRITPVRVLRQIQDRVLVAFDNQAANSPGSSDAGTAIDGDHDIRQYHDHIIVSPLTTAVDGMPVRRRRPPDDSESTSADAKPSGMMPTAGPSLEG